MSQLWRSKRTRTLLGQVSALLAVIIIFSLLAVNAGSLLVENISLPSDPANHPEYKVIKVVDGDTIDVDMDGIKKRIRLIGIDAPESVAPNQPVECFGKEAGAYLNSLLSGKVVQLADDSTQSDQDKYGRLLRYVFLGSVDINQKLLQEGFAREYTYDKAYQHQQEFRQAQAEAKIAKVGLWQENVCSTQK